MQNKSFIAIVLLLWSFATVSLAQPAALKNVWVREEKFGPLHTAIRDLLKKEIQVTCSKIYLDLQPKNVIEQLNDMSRQIDSVSISNINLQNHTFSAGIQTIDGHKILIHGTYKCFQSVPVVKKTIAAGQIIYEQDIKIQDFDLQFLNSLSGNFFKNSQQIVGMQAKTNIKSNSFLYFHEIKNPVVLKPQECVELVLHGNGFLITTKGKAMQSGSIGDLIKVQNIKSKKIIFGRIIDAKTVKIEAQ